MQKNISIQEQTQQVSSKPHMKAQIGHGKFWATNKPMIFATIIFMFLGIAYAWSLFINAISTEYPSWPTIVFSSVFSIQMVANATSSLLAGKIIVRVGKRKLYFLCAIGFLCGMCGAGLSHSPMALCFFYGAVCSFSSGLTYNMVIGSIVNLYENKSGQASGIVLMGYGMGGFLLGSIITWLHTTMGWRQTFFLLGILYAGLLCLCPLVLKENKGSLKQLELPGKYGTCTLHQAMRTKAFWGYYFWGVCITMIGLSSIAHIAQVTKEVKPSISYAVLLTGMLSVCNGIGRIVFGSMYDKRGRKRTMIFINSFLTLSIILMMVTIRFEIHTGLALAVILLGLGYGGAVPCNCSFAKEQFGTKYFANIFGFISSDCLISALIGPTLFSILVTRYGTYQTAFAACLLCCMFLWGTERVIK